MADLKKRPTSERNEDSVWSSQGAIVLLGVQGAGGPSIGPARIPRHTTSVVYDERLTKECYSTRDEAGSVRGHRTGGEDGEDDGSWSGITAHASDHDMER